MADDTALSGQDLTQHQVSDLIALAHPFVCFNDPATSSLPPVLPAGDPVIVDGFAFLNFTGIPASAPQREWPPADISKFSQMAQVITRLEEKIRRVDGAEAPPFNRIVHVKNMPMGNERGYGMDARPLLTMDYGETFHPQSDAELECVLAHEYAHQKYGDGKHNLDAVEDFLKSQPNGYLETYRDAPQEEAQNLERFPPVAIASILGNVRHSIAQYQQYVMQLYDYLQDSPHFAAPAEEILYRMETGDDAQRNYFAAIGKNLLSNMHNNAAGQMVTGTPTPLENIPSSAEDIQAFLDGQLAGIRAMQPQAEAMLQAVQAIKYAQEDRADRYMARVVDDPSAAKAVMMADIPEDRKHGTSDHPAIQRRFRNIDDAAAGRAIDEVAATGGFVNELLKDKNARDRPVRSPESQRGERDYAFAVARTAAGSVSEQRSSIPEKGTGDKAR